MNRKLFASIIVLTAVAAVASLVILSTASLIPVAAQNASNQDNAIVQPFYRQSHDLDILYLDDLTTTVTCPGEEKTKTAVWDGYHKRGKILYSWEDTELFNVNTHSHGRLSTPSGNASPHFYIDNARVDGPGNYFTMILTIDDDDKHMCDSFDPLFTMDVVGKCDGTMFEGISREPLGFNVTGTNFLVSCIP